MPPQDLRKVKKSKFKPMKPLDSAPLPHGAGKTWHNRHRAVDILKGKGAIYGVKLVLEVDKAEKLRNDLRDCINLARKYNRNNIEIDARFGAISQYGFGMDVKVYKPD